MRTFRHIAVIGALLFAAAFLTVKAYANGEIPFASSANQLNPHTCRFLHREVDPSPGPALANLRRFSVYEDARHDAKMSCLAQRHPVLIYKTATASGTGHTVTATCPAGLYVVGGGSHSETTGSYESGNDAWVVVRDHLSPRVLDVTAICIGVTQ